MARDWSISGPDLLLAPDLAGGRRAGIERALRDAIQDGRLAPGVRLPATRTLARELGVARGTVAEAYAGLTAAGYLVARQGSGTRVAPGARVPAPSAEPAAPAEPVRHDFRPGRADPSAFPRADWLRALRRALAHTSDDALQPFEPQGAAELRDALAAYLGRARGVLAPADRIVVTSGFTQALGLLARALRGSGARALAAEDPGLPPHREIATAGGLRVISLPVDGEGADPAGVDADVALVTPAHQFPLGPTLSAGRRAALLDWAREGERLVVEDDYDGEFRYDRQPVGALQGLDPERVVYAGTTSKALVAGFRLGWLVLPRALLEPVLAEKRLADWGSPVIDQLALAEFIESGMLDRHIRRMRSGYARRLRELTALVAEHAPSLRLEGIAAGLHALLALPPGAPPERELAARAAERGIGFAPLGHYSHGAPQRMRGLVLGYAASPQHAWPRALAALGDFLAESFRR